jgi:UDPglucose 6-dehydrogenase
MAKKILAHYGSGSLKGKTFAVWGLAFKPKTDDVREAPAMVVCSDLIKAGATLRAFDPEAMKTFAQKFGENPNLKYTNTNYEALEGADALIICTEWSEFRRPNFGKIKETLKSPVIFDGRNIYSTSEMAKLGFVYYSIGRPRVGM